MSELTREDVLQILELIDKAHYDFFELQAGDLKLVVNKTGLPGGGVLGASAPAAAPPPSPSSASSSAVPVPAGAPASTPPDVAGRSRAGLVPVIAPMIGTFYAQSEPGAPPFVQAGSHVDEEGTMGLIEVMKVFTAVRAGVSGTVVEIVVHNAEFVQYGQTLFYVRPDEASATDAG